MSLFDVHGSMQGRPNGVADADDALATVTDEALAAFLDDVRVLATAPAPEPTGDLAVLLRDGFAPVAPAPRPAARPTARLRRWASRAGVLTAPLGMKIAAAATAAAATFGGAAALGVLPDGLQQWASDVAGIINVQIPDGRPPVEPVSLDAADTASDVSRERDVESTAASVFVDDFLRGDRVAHQRWGGGDDRDRARDAEDAADGGRNRAEDAADDRRDAAEDDRDEAEDRADDDRDEAKGRADAKRDAAEDDRDEAKDRADDDRDEAKDRADDERDEADDAEDDADDAVDDAEDAADGAEDDAEDAADDADDAKDAKDAKDAAADLAEDAEDDAEDAKDD